MEGSGRVTDYLDPAPQPPPHQPLTRRQRRQDPYAEGDPADRGAPEEPEDDDLYENRDLSPVLPDRLRTAIDNWRSWWTPVDSLAMGIIAVQLFVLFVEVVGGSLYLDDLRAQAYALNQPFWSFIMDSNGTHFAPLPRILDWVQSRAFPLEHGPAVVVTLVVRLLFAIVFWRILRRIFGARMIVLVPLTLLLISPALLPATLWYRQSITIVACTVAMLWAVEAHLRWLQQGKVGALIEVVLATAVGVGFYEKAAAIPIVLTALTVALFARRPGRARRGGIPPVLRPTVISVGTRISCRRSTRFQSLRFPS